MGAALSYNTEPITTKSSYDGENAFFRFGVSSMQGWRVSMEDAHLIKPDFQGDLSLFGVFDGHGGKEVAEFVAKNLCEQLVSLPSFKMKNYEQSLIDCFLKMDQLIDTAKGRKALQEIARASGELRSEEDDGDIPQIFLDCKGCTANVILFNKNTIICANAGDSRCVLSKDGNAIPLSVDHKPTLESEKQRILKAGSTIENGRVDGNLNLSRCLGDLKYKRIKFLKPEDQPITAMPEVKKRILTKECDFLIMGCDGIWENMSSQNMVDFVSARLKKNPKIKLSKIIEEIFDSLVSPDYIKTAGVGCDNMTSIIVQFKKTFF